MTKRKSQLSILKVYAIVFLLGCIGFTIFNYDQLSAGEGWGIVGMVGLFGFGGVLLVADLILHNLITSRMARNIIGILLAIIATLMIIFGGFFS